VILDTQLEFSDAQAVTATAISTNVYDLFTEGLGATTTGVTPNTRLDIGAGEPVWLIVSTAVTATDTGSDATLVVSLETADNAALSTNAEVVFTTAALAFAAFATAGTRLVAVRLPAYLYRRYLGVRYTVANGPLTAGAFDAFIVLDADFQRYYRSGVVIQ
jgi:hypothetical protein